jgi:hypothetical protein
MFKSPRPPILIALKNAKMKFPNRLSNEEAELTLGKYELEDQLQCILFGGISTMERMLAKGWERRDNDFRNTNPILLVNG